MPTSIAPNILSDINTNAADMAVVVSFGYFLPKALLSRFKYTLNLHPSILPKYRGAAPIQHTIMNRDKKAGVSVIELSPSAFDVGRIYKQKAMEVGDLVDYQELEELLGVVGAEELADVVENIEHYDRIAFEQKGEASRAPKINRRMAGIDLAGFDSLRIHALYRGIRHQYQLYLTIHNRDLFLVEIKSPYEMEKEVQMLRLIEPRFSQEHQPGTIYMNSITNTLLIRTKNDWLGVKRLLMDTKQDAMSFVTGYKLKQFQNIQTFLYFNSRVSPSSAKEQLVYALPVLPL